MKKQFIALYGNQKILKAYCEKCETFAFVIDNRLQCCDRKISRKNPKFYKRETPPLANRNAMKKRDRDKQIRIQDNRCFYCDRIFGSYAFKKGKKILLEIVWDHFIPYSYIENNSSVNFVASCQICNHLKSDLCFQTTEEAKIYIQNEWDSKGMYLIFQNLLS